VLKDDGTPYFVFTPYYKKALKVLEHKDMRETKKASHRLIHEQFEGLICLHEQGFISLAYTLKNLGFEKNSVKIAPLKEKLEALKNKLQNYVHERDFFAKKATSNLSLELRFGVIGVRELLRKIVFLKNSEPFVRQLIFRDFYATLLFHLPKIEHENYKYKFNGIENKEKFQIFCEAKTGVPIVDAGVRELLKTGLMHNRVRMIVASFFTKDLLLPWQWGEQFFAQYLLDYDKASNVLSWQWSAGTGVDPQPYFRVFNPYLQSIKFDKEALYIKQYVPELKEVEAKNLHKEEYLLAHDIEGYPKPMLMHKKAAKIAIESFKKTQSDSRD
jgi:deoxyribodipyrimidine photo-lyase